MKENDLKVGQSIWVVNAEQMTMTEHKIVFLYPAAADIQGYGDVNYTVIEKITDMNSRQLKKYDGRIFLFSNEEKATKGFKAILEREQVKLLKIIDELQGRYFGCLEKLSTMEETILKAKEKIKSVTRK